MKTPTLSRTAVLAVIVLLAFSTRLLPTAISQFPFNNDALTNCAMASDILDAGRIDYSPDQHYYGTHAAITVAYDLLLAFVASEIGSSPLEVAQLTIATVSILSVCGGYLIAFRIVRDRESALAAALVIGLFGTLLFLTGSAWKMSLGFALLVLLCYAYMSRRHIGMFLLEIVILILLILVHHVVAFLAMLFITHLTGWSLFVAARKRYFVTQHLLDVGVVLGFTIVAAYYYWTSSLDRLSLISGDDGSAVMVIAIVITSAVVILVLSRRKHLPGTLAPVPGLLILALFVYDYYTPIFPYTQGAPMYVVLLGASYSLLFVIAWFGFEVAIESRSWYRALPLGMILPVITVVLFAFLRGMDESSHQIVYRTFDFAGLGMAVGVAVGFRNLVKRPKMRMLAVCCVIVALMVSFPYGYASGQLTGVRHDTQQYEVDAFEWLDTAIYDSYTIRSDERLSYIGMALYNFQNQPYLPQMLLKDAIPPLEDTVLMMEDEWMSTGVNDFPRGTLVYPEERILGILASSNVLYVGGPCSNSIIIFCTSAQGFQVIFEED